MAALASFAAGALALAVPANAQLVSADVSNDLTWTAGTDVIDDEDLRRWTPPSSFATVALGPVPGAADLAAAHELEDGRLLVVYDTFVDLGGGVQAGPEDIVAHSGAGDSIYFDGSAAGLPPGTRIDAVASARVGGEVATLLSFDVTVSLPGGVLADDEDLVSWSQGTWALVFDGSEAGVPAGLDLDAVAFDRFQDRLYLSFDGSGSIAGVDFDDEDLLARTATVWSLALDASGTLGAAFAAGDLDAVAVRAATIFQDGFEAGTTAEWSATQGGARAARHGDLLSIRKAGPASGRAEASPSPARPPDPGADPAAREPRGEDELVDDPLVGRVRGGGVGPGGVGAGALERGA